ALPDPAQPEVNQTRKSSEKYGYIRCDAMPVSELHAKPALTASPTSADTRRGRSAASVDEGIYRQIHHAIVAQQLAPGTKLGEEALCGVFGINRPRIRKILQRLAHEKLV